MGITVTTLSMLHRDHSVKYYSVTLKFSDNMKSFVPWPFSSTFSPFLLSFHIPLPICRLFCLPLKAPFHCDENDSFHSLINRERRYLSDFCGQQLFNHCFTHSLYITYNIRLFLRFFISFLFFLFPFH